MIVSAEDKLSEVRSTTATSNTFAPWLAFSLNTIFDNHSVSKLFPHLKGDKEGESALHQYKWPQIMCKESYFVKLRGTANDRWRLYGACLVSCRHQGVIWQWFALRSTKEKNREWEFIGLHEKISSDVNENLLHSSGSVGIQLHRHLSGLDYTYITRPSRISCTQVCAHQTCQDHCRLLKQLLGLWKVSHRLFPAIFSCNTDSSSPTESNSTVVRLIFWGGDYLGPVSIQRCLQMSISS